jgi:ATP-dependent DNA ligase
MKAPSVLKRRTIGLNFHRYQNHAGSLHSPQMIPMPLAHLHAPFDHADWIFAPKLDGFRAATRIEHGVARGWYPGIGTSTNPSRH